MIKIRKFIDKKIEGEYEIIKNHVIEIDVNKNALDDIAFKFFKAGDDPEEDYNVYGILIDYDGELDTINISKFLDAIERTNEAKNNVDEEELSKDLYDEAQKLKPYRGYSVDL